MVKEVAEKHSPLRRTTHRPSCKAKRPTKSHRSGSCSQKIRSKSQLLSALTAWMLSVLTSKRVVQGTASSSLCPPRRGPSSASLHHSGTLKVNLPFGGSAGGGGGFTGAGAGAGGGAGLASSFLASSFLDSSFFFLSLLPVCSPFLPLSFFLSSPPFLSSPLDFFSSPPFF